MRDRLVKLLQDNSYLDVLDEEHWLLAAEQLLANGVVVIDTDVVSLPNRPLISQYMGRPIDEVINLIRRSEWISVEERLPEVDTNVLVVTANGSFKVARCNIYHNGTLVLWATNDGLGERAITHWMPLPEPPKN